MDILNSLTKKFTILFALACLCGCATVENEHKNRHVGPLIDREVDERKVSYFVSPCGDDSNDGKSREKAFRSMQKAVDIVKPGETVLVRKGVYENGFRIAKSGRPDAWISIVAEPGVEIRGSDPIGNWRKESGDKNIYSIERPLLLKNYQRPKTSLVFRTEQFFVAGKLLMQVNNANMLKPGAFFVDDAKNRLFFCLEKNLNPDQVKCEVSKRTWAIAVGAPANQNFWITSRENKRNQGAYIKINGFKIRNIANFSRMAAIQIRGNCHHIIVENCDVQRANYCGIAANDMVCYSKVEKQWIRSNAHNIIIRNNITSNCGVQGIGGGGVSEYLIDSNIVDYNNYKGFSGSSEGGGIKTGFEGDNITYRNNVLRYNNNQGLWFDYARNGCIIENNLVLSSKYSGILIECTPTPGIEYTEDGKKLYYLLKEEQIRNLKQKGVVLRNNIVVKTTNPLGVGIDLSTSCDNIVTNNISYHNAGPGMELGGSWSRSVKGPRAYGGTQGQARNQIFGNISLQDFYGFNWNFTDEDDKTGRTFGNVLRDNLFISSRNGMKLRGLKIDAAKVAEISGEKNFYSKKCPFRDPERLDFSISDSEELKRIGFDASGMRLDWSEFYLPPKKNARKKGVENMVFTPISMNAVFNRALVDEKPDDGRGGWSDQGKNDMGLLPNGKQSFNGIEYLIGPKEKGALLLENQRIEGCPDTVDIKVSGKYSNLFFLYAAAWSRGKMAEFVIKYSDGSSASISIKDGVNVLDWWLPPFWTQVEKLESNGAFLSWSGPNQCVSKVTLYSLNWKNPHPDKEIASIVIKASGEESKKVTPMFFLLAISGANPRPTDQAEAQRSFFLNFDGNIDAIDSKGNTIEPEGINKFAFNAGRFEPGKDGQAFRINTKLKKFYYETPQDFPSKGEGCISMWLKADDWSTPGRIKQFRKCDYKRHMVPFEIPGSDWRVSITVMPPDFKKIKLRVATCGWGQSVDVTELIKPGKWFNVKIVWQANPKKGGNWRQRKIYLDGKEIASKDIPGLLKKVTPRIYVGCPSNGGQPWIGLMDNLEIWKRQ